MNVDRALLFQSDCSLKFWSECVLIVVFLINRTPSSILNDKKPFELIIGKQSNYSMFRSFGCLAYASLVHETNKCMPRALECVFLGYVDHKKAYKLLDLRSNKLFFSMDVKFYENVFSFTLKENVEFENDKISSKFFPFYDIDVDDVFD